MVKDLCFEIIESCPNECKFCSSNSCIDKKQIIAFDDFKRVIDYFISEGGIEELSLSGGEPFLHPDIYKMVEYAASFGIRIVIFTSGIKRPRKLDQLVIDYYYNKMQEHIKEIELHEPWNHRLMDNIRKYYENLMNPNTFSPIEKSELKKLKDLGLSKIVFDYQAYEHETDEFLMGRDRVKHACLLDSMLNASVIGIETDVHFIPMKPNYKELPDILEMLEIAGIGNISLLNFVPQGRGRKNVDDLLLSRDEMLEVMSILEKSRSIYSGNIRIGIPLSGEDTHKCNAGLEKLDIKFDGTVLPCPAFKEIDRDTAKKYGIKLHNIYEDLESVKTPGGKRVFQLCKKIYNNRPI